MLSLIAMIALSQIPITGSSAFTRVPYNTPLGFGLANRQPPLGFYTFNPPGIANPKVITIPRRAMMPTVIDDNASITGIVIAADAVARTMVVRLDDGNVHDFDLGSGTKWVDNVGRFELRLGKTRVSILGDTVTIVR